MCCVPWLLPTPTSKSTFMQSLLLHGVHRAVGRGMRPRRNLSMPEYACRKKMILPTGGAAELPVAVCVEGMKRVYDMMARTEGWIEAKCVQCPVEKAVAFCRGCSEFICSGCVDTHERNRRSFFGHVVSNLRDMNEEQIMNISRTETLPASALSMTRRLTCSVMIAIVSFVVTAPLLITETTTLPF